MLDGLKLILVEASIKSTCELKIFLISKGSITGSPLRVVVLVLTIGCPSSLTI